MRIAPSSCVSGNTASYHAIYIKQGQIRGDIGVSRVVFVRHLIDRDARVAIKGYRLAASVAVLPVDLELGVPNHWQCPELQV